MSDRERAIELLSAVPDYKIGYVVAYLQGVTAGEIEEVEPDDWDLEMIAEAERENDGTKTALDEMLKKDGLTYADLQNWVWKGGEKVSW